MDLEMKSFPKGAAFLLFVLALQLSATEASALPDEGWKAAHATFYGGSDVQGTNGGACGYQNVFALGYGSMTTAISPQLYGDGNRCGACFEVRCTGARGCLYSSVIVTATNQGPQWSTEYPGPHFHLAQPAFNRIADITAGHVPIEYRRVNCVREGGIKFAIHGQRYSMQVLVYNVGGKGDVSGLAVKGQRSEWIQMIHLWGQIWSTQEILDGQSLCFRVTSSDGRSVTSCDVAPAMWHYGKTYEGSQF
ncbi:hypothetical protein R1flu_015817 [Riccia fluitans]|uniref:Expansin n=1 Tax=Riccia fluitans TaxID=41844 RepID=A0ABD1YKH8_9MARC